MEKTGFVLSQSLKHSSNGNSFFNSEPKVAALVGERECHMRQNNPFSKPESTQEPDEPKMIYLGNFL